MTATTGHMDPRIGVLMREGRHVYYAYPRGHSLPPVEGCLEVVQDALAVKHCEAALVDSTATGDQAARGRLHRYAVEVTPALTVYSGSSTFGRYEVEVAARTAKEACSKVRADRRREDGRFVVPANFRGRRLTD